MKTKQVKTGFLKQAGDLFKGLLDKRTPWYAKIIGIAILAYIFFPFDFLTDLAPVFGWLDDTAVAAVGIFIIARLIPKDVAKELEEK